MDAPAKTGLAFESTGLHPPVAAEEQEAETASSGQTHITVGAYDGRRNALLSTSAVTMHDHAQDQIDRLADAVNRLAAAIEERVLGDSAPVTQAEVRELFATQAEKIDLILAEVRPLGQNAIIERIRARGWANLNEASVYLGRSDTFLRRYLDQPGDGNPDPAKLNGQKGPKDWTFTVTELDRFNRNVLRASSPTSDLEGQEIRSSSR